MDQQPIQVDQTKTLDRSNAKLNKMLAAAIYESAQWEQAYHDLKEASDAVIGSLSAHVDSLTAQLEATRVPTPPAEPGEDEGKGEGEG